MTDCTPSFSSTCSNSITPPYFLSTLTSTLTQLLIKHIKAVNNRKPHFIQHLPPFFVPVSTSHTCPVNLCGGLPQQRGGKGVGGLMRLWRGRGRPSVRRLARRAPRRGMEGRGEEVGGTSEAESSIRPDSKPEVAHVGV